MGLNVATCKQVADLSRNTYVAPPVAVPGVLLGVSTCVAHRPRPLARVAASATGSAPLAPPWSV